MATQALIQSLMSDDVESFRRFEDRLDFPMRGKCVWLRAIIDDVLSNQTNPDEEECWLREDLTPAERQQYLLIAIKYANHELVTQGQPRITAQGRRMIPPGPFREELRANNLLFCEPGRISDSIVLPVLGRPELFCFPDAPLA
jgi:hypothetical protein